MPDPVNAIYKRYNGTEWVPYYFKTTVAQILTSTTRKFISNSVTVNGVGFTLDNTANGASVTIGGANITGGASVANGSLTYISASDTVAAALGKLDQAAKAAYDNIPSGILTTNNYATTLDSVYQAKDNDLTAIAGLTGTSGFLKKTAADTWELDTSTYVPTTRTINGKALSSNVTLYGADIVMTGTYTNVATYLLSLEDRISSVTQNYAIDITAVTGYANDSLASNDATIEISTRAFKFLLLDGETELASGDLNVGDSIYITNEDYPDRWYAGTSGSGSSTKHIFKRLETTRLLWANIASKPTTLSGYGITDAHINNGVITLGGNTITPLTQHQDISGKANDTEVVHNTGAETVAGVKTFNNTIQAADGINIGNTNSIRPIVINSSTSGNKFVRLYPTTNNSGNCDIYLPAKAGTLAMTSDIPVVQVGTEAPSNPTTGNIWLDTTA